MKFDPMTGEPIEEVEAMPVEPQKKSGVKVGIIVAAAVCVVAIVALIIALVSGLFMSDKDRVMQAIGNTFKEGGAMADLYEDYAAFAKEEELTTAARVDYQGVGIQAEYRHTNADKQYWALIDMTGYPEIEGTVTITDGQVQAATPFLNDILFVYNYREDNDGYLMQQFSSEEIELINQACEILYSAKSGTDANIEVDEDVTKAIKEWYDAIEVEKLEEKEEFEINGKDKKCTGYRMYITEDTVIDFLEIYKDVLKEYDDISYTVDGVEVSVDEVIDVLIDEVDGMDDIEIDFYLDSNKLAAIVTEVEGEDLEILFLGGDYRAQNILVEYDGDEVIEIQCEMKDKVEELAFLIGGEEVFVYEYDTESGEFEGVAYYAYGGEAFVIEGTFVTEKDRFAFEKGEFEIPDENMKLDLEFAIEKGAEIETLEGDILDIGEASASELQDALAFFY